MPVQTSRVIFQFQTSCQLTGRKRLKEFIRQIFTIEGKSLSEITYVFCSDEYLLELNKSFLEHDYYTDIITFDLSEENDRVVGEVYISVDRVRDNAGQVGVSFNTELLRVVFHGALHLCGYKDKRATDKTVMTAAEDKYLALYNS
ncbi:MAG: rRNA maturation RNase YbeY [Chitinophagaceae bacterium]|nr:MAG: rRNA maturation RNase YbeY [Chitinophagaceae bacterium]